MTVGEMLAVSNDEEQAKALNDFATALRVLCKQSEFNGFDMQAHYIARKLNNDAVHLFREILASVEHLQGEGVRGATEEYDRLQHQLEHARNELREVKGENF